PPAAFKKAAPPPAKTGDKLAANAGPASGPGSALPSPTAEQGAALEMGADGATKEEVTVRPEPTLQASAENKPAASPPAPPAARADAARGQSNAAKPQAAEGALHAAKAAGVSSRAVTVDEVGFAEQFEAVASRPLRTAEEARAAAQQWTGLA